MAPDRPFRHQVYETEPPVGSFEFLAGALPELDEAVWQHRVAQFGEVLRAANVAAIYLIHGTFAGNDPLGVLTGIGRLVPRWSDAVRGRYKMAVDVLAGQRGNYSPQFAQKIEAALNPDGQVIVPVRRFGWSSENHHIGRADAAIRLLDRLAEDDLPSGGRILCWAHSHGGNALALLSSLVSGHRDAVDEFFAHAEIYFRWPMSGRVDLPVWERVRRRLAENPTPLANNPLDIVTFGTPVRYGWHAASIAKLLHVVNHRPAGGVEPHRAAFPPDWGEVLDGAAGDFVQQFGIAGTNTPPGLLAWRARRANRQMAQLLQPGMPRRELLGRLKLGTRVADTGKTLLVDYGPQEGSVRRQLLGHAVYTKAPWLPLHAEQIAAQFYSDSLPK